MDKRKLIKHVQIYRPDLPADLERAVRLYCSQHDQKWELQIRGPNSIGPFGTKDGKNYLIADASLNRNELIWLRDTINEALA